MSNYKDTYNAILENYYNPKPEPDDVVVPDGSNVLIVEDKESEQLRAKEAVLKEGYVPFVVRSFLQARSALKQKSFKAVLSDLNYPHTVREMKAPMEELSKPQPFGITLVFEIEEKSNVAIVTDQFHHGPAQWASTICVNLKVRLFDEVKDGGKQWKEALRYIVGKS